MPSRRASRWRLALSWLLLLLFCLTAPLALLSGWAWLTVRDEERYLTAMRAVADDPRVQSGLAQAVANQSELLLGGENPTATEAVQNRVIADALSQATGSVVASEEFRDAWVEANRQAHRLLFTDLAAGRGQPVDLDLTPLRDPLQIEIDALGLELTADLTLEPEMLRLELLDAASADRIRDTLFRADLAFWGSLAVAVVSLILSVALAPDRLAAAGRAAFGLAVAMAATIALMLIGQGALAARIGAGAGEITTAIIDAISQGLRLGAIGLALAGLLVAGTCAGLNALRSSLAGRPARA